MYLGDDNLLSTPLVLSPNGGETLNDIVNVQWQKATSLWNSPVQYDVYISGDNGQSWQLIATGLIANSFYFDSNLLPDGDQYMIRVVAIDAVNGQISEDFSDSSFEIDNIPSPGGSGIDPVFAGGSLILLGRAGVGGFFVFRRIRR